MSEHVLDKEKQVEKQKQQLEPPKKYHVFIMNDDFTEWPFVIEMLTRYFGQTEDQANRTTKDVHTKGKGLAGTYTKDVAESKAQVMNDHAQNEGFPLHAQAEQEE